MTTSSRPGVGPADPNPPVVSLEALDFLRGIAALMVVLNHVRGVWQVGGRTILASGQATGVDYIGIALLQVTSFGKEFVILFFVLSGYAMANSLRYTSSVPRFYLKRVIRIWPPYLLALMFAVAASHLVADPIFSSPSSFVGAMFYVNTNSAFTPQFWSLPHEVVFYILCPLILTSERRVHISCVVSVALCAVTVATKGMMLNPYQMFVPDFLGNEMLFFSCGAMAYYHLGRVPVIRGVMLFASLGALMVVALAFKLYFKDANLPANLCIIAATLIVLRNLPAALARQAWWNLGYCSYSIYLFHYACLPVMTMLAGRYAGVDMRASTSYTAWMIGVPPILLVCWLFYLLAERPTSKLLARLRSADGAAATSDRSAMAKLRGLRSGS